MDSDIAHMLPSGVEHREAQDLDIIAWSNKDIPINKGQILAHLLAIPLGAAFALFFTISLFFVGLNDVDFIGKIFMSGGFVFCWVFVAAALLSLPRITWYEAIKISDEHIELTYSGWGAPKKEKCFSKHIFLKLVFEKYGVADDMESYPALYILYAGQFLGFDVKKRERLAMYMGKKERYQLFLLLQHLLKERNW